MKALRKILDNVRPHFQKGGKFEKLHSVYDGMETFLFVPGHTTHSGAHIRDAIDLKRTMGTVVLAMIPCLLFGMWNVGYQHHLAIGADASSLIDNFMFGLWKVLPMLIVSYGVGLAIEFAAAQMRNHSINEGFLVSGMLIPLILPVDMPLWMIGVGTAFAVIIGKEVFGGTGMNILNVALTARAFLFFAYPKSMSGNEVWVNTKTENGQAVVDGFTGATPLGDAAGGLADRIPSMWDSFVGTISGSVGETSTLACLIGAFILIMTGVGSWRIMVSFFAGGYAMGLIFNAFALNTLMEIDAVHHLLLGGFAFGAVYMATDPVTASQTPVGKLIYGFLAGFFAIMIRVFNPAYPEGVMMAILFMNVMAPLIDHYVVQANVRRRLKRVPVKVS